MSSKDKKQARLALLMVGKALKHNGHLLHHLCDPEHVALAARHLKRHGRKKK